jgi:hypothetical protein
MRPIFSKVQLYYKSKVLASFLNININQKFVGTTKDTWTNIFYDLVKKTKREKKKRNKKLISFNKLKELTKSFNINDKYNTVNDGTNLQFQKEIKRLEKIKKDGKILWNTKFNELLENRQYQEILFNVVHNERLLKEEQADRFWNEIYNNDPNRWLFKLKQPASFDYQFFTVGNATKNFILDFLMKGPRSTTELGYVSDGQNVEITSIEDAEFEKYIPPVKVIKNKDGHFFPYINTSNIDLQQYQVYNQLQAYNEELLKERQHCFIHCLEYYNIEEAKINEVKLSFDNNCSFRKSNIKEVVNIINKNIDIHTLSGNKLKIEKIKTKLKNNEESIKIALFENHYFPFEITKYNKFFIDNYEKLKDVKDNQLIYKIIPDKKNNKFYYLKSNKSDDKKISSLRLIEKFFNKGLFQKLDLSKFEETNAHQKLKNHVYLGNIENEQREIKNKETTKREENIFYCDNEAFVNGEYHELYLLGISNMKNNFVDILNITEEKFNGDKQKLIYHFLNNITNNGKTDAKVYYHNLKYDFNLIEMCLNLISTCEKDNLIYNGKAKYKDANITFVDSYKIAPIPLGKFGTEFNLPMEYRKKEAIAYKYYTKENNNKIIHINEYLKLLPKNEHKIFLKNMEIEKSFNKKDKTFNPTSYYLYYLKYDCLTLKMGLLEFEKMILKITKNKLSIFNSLTISSLSDKYLRLCGAYDNIFEIKGNLRNYISQAITGGRVHVNEKFKKKIIKKKIQDFDGVSLYPSAIYRMCLKEGFPRGMAKRLINFLNWESYDYAIMTVKITKVNKNQQMPFIAHKIDGKSIDYKNEIPTENVIIDKRTLQDYIEFHQIEYEIIDGVYWDEGFNNKAGQVVNELFQIRLECKKKAKENGNNDNNALENVIKLMLNSLYGKTMLSKSDTKNKILKQENFNTYFINNFNTIKSYRKINAYTYQITEIICDNSYNRAHIGISILSMSKRIMNELFNTANDNNITIFYTDTDSIHCLDEDIPKLEKEFIKKYNRELIGKNLGQFHNDFKMKNAVSSIYSTKSIFLGKKSYIDCLESTDKDGKTINDYHIRLKGITVEGINNIVKNEYKNNAFNLFKDLSEGIEKEILLNPFDEENNKQKELFKIGKGKISFRLPFNRKIKF